MAALLEDISYLCRAVAIGYISMANIPSFFQDEEVRHQQCHVQVGWTAACQGAACAARSVLLQRQ